MKNSLSVTFLVLVWSATLGATSAQARGVANVAAPSSAPAVLQGPAVLTAAPLAPGTASAADVPGSMLEAAGCAPDWIATFGGLPGPNSSAHAMVVFDYGTGPALIVGGSFKSAGGVEANRIARWDGSTWSPLGSGFEGEAVLALAVFDDGGGPALYAAGRFTSAGGVPASHIAKWDGSAWSPVGLGVSGYVATAVHALTVHDDGSGPALVAAGRFASAGLVAANCVAKWDGAAWSALGSGLNPNVLALAVHDDGGGARLFAGGEFSGGGGVALANIAQWDGVAWSPLGIGMNGPVLSLVSFDDGLGGGPALIAGGTFSSAGGVGANRIAKWDGATWSTLAAGLGGDSTPAVRALAVHDEGLGAGQVLFASGSFSSSGGLTLLRIARWDGTSWSALDAGMTGGGGLALAVFDDGVGSRGALYVGGGIAVAGTTPVSHVARWDGAAWSALGANTGTNYWTYAVAEFDDGSGPALYTGGSFSAAGGIPAARVARWDGSAWSPLGSGLNSDVYALSVFDDGGGPALYAGGGFTSAGGVDARRIAKWDGSNWSSLGPSVGGAGDARALHAFDDGGGPALYVGGSFSNAGGVFASNVARWDGTHWWGLGQGFNDIVEALVSFDDGSGAGPALYAGGAFSMSGVVPVSYLAKWDGVTWSQVGGGVNGRVSALAVYDDGTGEALYAAGYFTTAGGVPSPLIARWDGSTWSALGSGGPDPFFGANVGTLAVFDPGTGPELFAGGSFTSIGGTPTGRMARWNGTSWHALGEGVNDYVLGLGLGVVDVGLGQGPSLYTVGRFTVSPERDSYIARWGCTSSSIGYAYCFGDGSGTACPCANAGGPAEGCANSTGAGAVLGASGSNGAGANDLVLHARRVPAFQPALLFVGNVESNGGSGFTFGDGLRCAAFGVRRLGVSIASAGGHASWGPGLGSLGEWIAGDTRRFQAWYRDPLAGPCGSGFNLSNGFGLTFTP